MLCKAFELGYLPASQVNHMLPSFYVKQIKSYFPSSLFLDWSAKEGDGLEQAAIDLSLLVQRSFEHHIQS